MWRSWLSRLAHNQKFAGSSPAVATTTKRAGNFTKKVFFTGGQCEINAV